MSESTLVKLQKFDHSFWLLACLCKYAARDHRFKRQLQFPTRLKAHNYRQKFHSFRSRLMTSGLSTVSEPMYAFTLYILPDPAASTWIVSIENSTGDIFSDHVASVNPPTPLPGREQIEAEAIELRRTSLAAAETYIAERSLKAAEANIERISADPRALQRVIATIGLPSALNMVTPTNIPSTKEPTAPIDPHSLLKEHKLLSPGEDVANDTISALFPRATPTTDKPA